MIDYSWMACFLKEGSSWEFCRMSFNACWRFLDTVLSSWLLNWSRCVRRACISDWVYV